VDLSGSADGEYHNGVSVAGHSGQVQTFSRSRAEGAGFIQAPFLFGVLA